MCNYSCKSSEPHREWEDDDLPPKLLSSSSKKSRKKTISPSTKFSTPRKSIPNSYLEANATISVSSHAKFHSPLQGEASPLVITPCTSSISRSSSSDDSASRSIKRRSNTPPASPVIKNNIPPHSNHKIRRKLSYCMDDDGVMKSCDDKLSLTPQKKCRVSSEKKTNRFTRDKSLLSHYNKTNKIQSPCIKRTIPPTSQEEQYKLSPCRKSSLSDEKKINSFTQDESLFSHDKTTKIHSPCIKRIITPTSQEEQKKLSPFRKTSPFHLRKFTPSLATPRGEATLKSIDQVERAVNKTYSKLHQFALQSQISSHSTAKKQPYLIESPNHLRLDYPNESIEYHDTSSKHKNGSIFEIDTSYEHPKPNITKATLIQSLQDKIHSLENQIKTQEETILGLQNNFKNQESNQNASEIIIHCLNDKISMLEDQIVTKEETIQYQRRENEKLLDLIVMQKEENETVVAENDDVKKFLDYLVVNKDVLIHDYLKRLVCGLYDGSIQADKPLLLPCESFDDHPAIEIISEYASNEKSLSENTNVITDSCREDTNDSQPTSSPALKSHREVQNNSPSPIQSKDVIAASSEKDTKSEEEIPNRSNETIPTNYEELNQLQDRIEYLEENLTIWKDIANGLQDDLLNITNITNEFFVNMSNGDA